MPTTQHQAQEQPYSGLKAPPPRRSKSTGDSADRRMKDAWKAKYLIAEAEREYPADVWAQYEHILVHHRMAASRGRARSLSDRSVEKIAECFRAFFTTLYEENIRLRNLSDVTHKHFGIAVRVWEARGRSNATLANRYSSIRRLFLWLGKDRNLPQLAKMLVDPERAKCKTSATVAKDWASLGIDFHAIAWSIEQDCPFTAMHLRLADAFGLRAKEAMWIKPREADQGDTLVLIRGTKGKLERRLPILTEYQRTVLDEAKAMADTQTGLVGKYGHNYPKARNHFYYICRKFGLTKAALGCTPHGLRSGYANQRHLALTGQVSAVAGGQEPPREVEVEACSKISKELGHARPQITAAYNGTHGHISKEQKKNMDALIKKFESAELRLEVAQVRKRLADEGYALSFAVFGNEALGRPVKAGDSVTLAATLWTVNHRGTVPEDAFAECLGRAIYCLVPHFHRAAGRTCTLIDSRFVDGELPRMDLFI